MPRMLRSLARALVAASLLAGAALAQDRTVTLITVNDTHSHLDAVGPKDSNLDGTVGGLVKASAVIGALRASEPGALFLHAGDLFMGDSYFNATLGSVELQLLSALGLDAMVIGNHELWLPAYVFGSVYDAAFRAGGAFPVLGANVEPSPFLPFLRARMVREVGGVRVGLFGLVTPFDRIAAQHATFRGGERPDATALVGIAAAEAAALRAEGAEVVVLLSHLGIDLDRAIAAHAPGVDAIVGGHDHLSIAETVNGVAIVHAGAHYRQVGKIRLAVGAAGVSGRSTELVEVDAKVRRPLPGESPIAAGVAQAQRYVTWRLAPVLQPERYGDFFHQPIAVAAGRISNAIDPAKPKRDSATGNLVTDALRWRTGTEIAFTVAGQTAEGIAEGPIVGEDLFRMVGLGFDATTQAGWRIATMTITGAELLKALETTIELAAADGDYMLQVSGMRYAYDSGRAAPPRLVSLEIGGAPIDPARTYTATVNALLWSMLPAIGVVPSGGAVLDDFEFSALRDYAIALGTLDPSGENRVRDVAARGRR